MAKVLKNFQFKARARPSKHPWDEWLDGQTWEIGPRDWGQAKPEAIISQARNQASRRGLRVRITSNKDRGSLILQSYSG